MSLILDQGLPPEEALAFNFELPFRVRFQIRSVNPRRRPGVAFVFPHLDLPQAKWQKRPYFAWQTMTGRPAVAGLLGAL